MSKPTPFHDEHLKSGAKMVDFAGWRLPLHYGSQLGEHRTVRGEAGIFDVSHMVIIDVQGEQAFAYLQYLLANDVAKLDTAGKALYSCMLNEQAGIVDDLIVYFLKPNLYRLVVNAGTGEKDLAWMLDHAKPFSVNLVHRQDLAILAVQGPEACTKLSIVFYDCIAKIQMLSPFRSLFYRDLLIACTGYTGEDGFEIILPAEKAVSLWRDFRRAGCQPCGLGARDILRLEAGLNLYGIDMDETTTPFESNLDRTITFTDNRDFIGRAALDKQRFSGRVVPRKLIGLVEHERGAILRRYQRVVVNNMDEGEVTSGTFSPVLGKSIGLARIPLHYLNQSITSISAEIRGRLRPVEIVDIPFVKRGQRNPI